MDLQQTVNEHTKQLEKHETEIKEIKKTSSEEIAAVKREISQWNATLREGLTRVDESNKYLREQNQDILKAIIGRNESSSERQFEMEKMKEQSRTKIALTILGSGGIVYAIIDLLIKTFR